MTKIAILSTAHIHTPGFVRHLKERTDIQVAAVYDPNPVLAQKYAAELNVPVAASPEPLLNDPSIEGVVITGTTGQHNCLVVPAAKAKKHMFVEKPLAVSSHDANRMYQAIKEAGVIFQTGHFMRSNAMHRFIKQELDAGNLGTVTRARCSNCHHGALAGWFDKEYRWFFDAAEAGGGGFYDLGCHALDLLVFFFGPAVSATAAIAGQKIKYPNIDEYGEGLVRFANGATGSVVGAWVDVANPVFLEIAGTEGHITIFNGSLYYQSSKSKVPGADAKQPIDKAHFPAELPGSFPLFLDVLVGKADKNLLIPIEDSLNVAKAMEAMYLGEKLSAWVKV